MEQHGFGNYSAARAGRGRAHTLQHFNQPEIRRPANPPIAFMPAAATLPMGGFQHGTAIDVRMAQPQQSGPSLLSRSTLSAEAQEFYPPGYKSESEKTNCSNLDGGDFENVEQDEVDTFLNDIQGLVFGLTRNPGYFDSMSVHFTKIIQSSVENAQVLRQVVEIIFDQSVMEMNFRYTGARLCQKLAQMNLPMRDGNFRQAILNRCREEHERRMDLLENDPERLRGYTLFLAELYIQMEIKPNKTVQHIEKLRDALPTLILTLLKKPTKDNLKCVCQALKLAGCTMQDEGANLDKTMDEIKTLTLDVSIERHMKEMMLKVVELKACNWGRATAFPLSHSNINSPDLSEGAVLYGPDGQVMSPEESEFLEESAFPGESDEEFGENSDLDFGSLSIAPDEMDDEAHEDYEKFLNMSKQQ